MRLVTSRLGADGAGRLGVLHPTAVGEMAIDVERLGRAVGEAFPATMLELIDMGPDALAALARAVAETEGIRAPGVAVPSGNVRLLAPIPRPRKNVFGIGLNYVEHVDESARSLDTSKDRPEKPVVFSMPPTAVIGPGEPIPHDGAMTRQLDWEVELAVVIGRRASRVARETRWPTSSATR